MLKYLQMKIYFVSNLLQNNSDFGRMSKRYMEARLVRRCLVLKPGDEDIGLYVFCSFNFHILKEVSTIKIFKNKSKTNHTD